MKIFKRFVIAILIIFSLASLSSCAFFERALEKIGLGGSGETTTETTTSSLPKPSDKTNPAIEPTTTSSKPTVESSTNTSRDSSSTTTKSTIASSLTSTSEEELVLEYGYKDWERYANKDNYQGLYIKFRNALDDFSKSTSNVNGQNLDVSGVTSTYYIFEDVEYTEFNISADEALAVLKTVLLDNPRFYFVSNTLLTYHQTQGSTSKYYIKLAVDDEYALSSKRLEYNNKIAEFEGLCYAGILDEMTVEEKVKHVHDYIVAHAQYAYEADGVTPSTKSISHNMVGIPYEGKGVCEAYAELFTYLLKNLGIPTVTASGMGYTSTSPMGEAHAWNYVYIDSEYYGFDVTWDDSARTYDYYGMSYNSLTYGRKSTNGRHSAYESYISNGINYLYRVPSASTNDIIVS